MQFIFVSIPANNCLKTATQKAYPFVFSRLCLLDTDVDTKIYRSVLDF